MRAAGADQLSDAEVRRRLKALGERRKKLRKLEEDLADDTVELMPDVRLSKVSMEEAADRLGLNRTTIYQVYLPRVQENANGTAKRARPASSQ